MEDFEPAATNHLLRYLEKRLDPTVSICDCFTQGSLYRYDRRGNDRGYGYVTCHAQLPSPVPPQNPESTTGTGSTKCALRRSARINTAMNVPGSHGCTQVSQPS